MVCVTKFNDKTPEKFPVFPCKISHELSNLGILEQKPAVNIRIISLQ